MDREEVRRSAELSRAIQRLQDLPEWQVFVRELRELEADLLPGLKHSITDHESTLRLTRLQGKLEMLDLILELPDLIVADAAAHVAAYQRKEKTHAR